MYLCGIEISTLCFYDFQREILRLPVYNHFVKTPFLFLYRSFIYQYFTMARVILQ